MNGKLRVVAAGLVAILLGASAAVADWDPGDGHKMHYPQLPDPNGWDVAILVGSTSRTVADDWLCTGTGPVEDIHFWVSYREDDVEPIRYVGVELFSNDPGGAGEHSHPDQELWSRDFYGESFTQRLCGSGQQGWISMSGAYIQDDHSNYYQINIDDISNPFIQTQGEIYWLAIHIAPKNTPFHGIGWKTSQDHWNDNAVTSPYPGWPALIDPITSEPLDLAFVITPEPATLSLMALGACLLLLRRRR